MPSLRALSDYDGVGKHPTSRHRESLCLSAFPIPVHPSHEPSPIHRVYLDSRLKLCLLVPSLLARSVPIIYLVLVISPFSFSFHRVLELFFNYILELGFFEGSLFLSPFFTGVLGARLPREKRRNSFCLIVRYSEPRIINGERP